MRFSISTGKTGTGRWIGLPSVDDTGRQDQAFWDPITRSFFVSHVYTQVGLYQVFVTTIADGQSIRWQPADGCFFRRLPLRCAHTANAESRGETFDHDPVQCGVAAAFGSPDRHGKPAIRHFNLRRGLKV